MAWNEPGNNGQDPWGRRGANQGPPDLDEMLKKLRERFAGGGSGGGGSDDDSEYEDVTRPLEEYVMGVLDVLSKLNNDIPESAFDDMKRRVRQRMD